MTTASTTALAPDPAADDIPKARFDWVPIALVAALAAIGWAFERDRKSVV